MASETTEENDERLDNVILRVVARAGAAEVLLESGDEGLEVLLAVNVNDGHGGLRGGSVTVSAKKRTSSRRRGAHLEHLGPNSLTTIPEPLARNEQIKEGRDIGSRKVWRDELEGGGDGLASAPGILGVERLLDDHAVLVIDG